MQTKRVSSALIVLACLVLFVCSEQSRAADTAPLEIYKQLEAFKVGASMARVENLVLERDRVKITFTGDFYFAEPVDGAIYGMVFLGRGQLRSEPWNISEQESVKRFLNQDVIEATFTKAVFRFSDDTLEKIAGRTSGGAVPGEAQALAANFDQRLIRETGLNINSRLLLSIVAKEKPGFFFAEFDGGNRGRFGVVLDRQTRVPGSIFSINGGEKGLIFKYQGVRYSNDVWTAFYDDEDFRRGTASYSDAFDLVTIPNYKLEIDLRDPGNWLRMDAKLQLSARSDNVQVLPMQLNEGLEEVDNERRNKSVRVVKAEMADGTPVSVIQDEWESGFTLVFPTALPREKSVEVTLKLEGKDSLWSWQRDFHYPRSSTSWYPRHGYLSRSRFDVTYRHRKNQRVASIGQRVREGAVDGRDEEWVTQWVIDEPVSFITFVCGRFERHVEKVEIAGKQIPIEYYSPPGNIQAVKEDFILAEIGNAVRYFSELFGPYPYGRLGGAYFPASYGQGFPTLLLLPVEGYALKDEFAFMAHENAHQWWGNIVGWRSYRDQWLSEGFADYSGVLYTARRSNRKDSDDLLKEMRRTLVDVPKTLNGVGKGKLFDVGPVILGHRLTGTQSINAGILIYSKGALVLRMLHYLLTNPDTLDDKGFFDMMKDFVDRHRNDLATSESFMQIAGEHFARSPLGQRYGIKDLNWFFKQWVLEKSVPNYSFDYRVESREGGGFTLRGTLLQENAPGDWFMPLPLLLEFSGNRVGRITVAARGTKTPIEVRLPEKPQRVRLDPDLWILSEKTSERAN
jgi:hypothetical protein